MKTLAILTGFYKPQNEEEARGMRRVRIAHWVCVAVEAAMLGAAIALKN